MTEFAKQERDVSMITMDPKMDHRLELIKLLYKNKMKYKNDKLDLEAYDYDPDLAEYDRKSFKSSYREGKHHLYPQAEYYNELLNNCCSPEAISLLNDQYTKAYFKDDSALHKMIRFPRQAL